MTRRTYYFMLTFWGEEYSELFYSLLLPTLLSPNNFPVLKARPGSRLLIATTNADWDSLKDRPLVNKLREYAEILILRLEPPGPNDLSQLHMSKGHRMAARRAFEDGAVAGFLAPDLLCSDGLIARAVEHIESGKKVVLCPALRFAAEAVIDHLNAHNLLKPNAPTTLDPKFLGSVAANSLHPEILRYDFDGKDFDYYPIWTFWRVPERNGLVIYTWSWALLLGDYSEIKSYKDDFLERTTIDGFYVWRNFGHLKGSEAVALIDDSFDGLFLSLTPRDALAFRRSGRLANFFFDAVGLGTLKRLFDIGIQHHSSEIDPWRQWLHSQPIVIHGDERDDRYEWQVERTRGLMMAAFYFGQRGSRRLPNIGGDANLEGEVFSSRISATAFRLLFKPFMLALRSYPIRLVVGILTGELSAIHLLRRALHILSFGLMYYPRAESMKRQ